MSRSPPTWAPALARTPPSHPRSSRAGSIPQGLCTRSISSQLFLCTRIPQGWIGGRQRPGPLRGRTSNRRPTNPRCANLVRSVFSGVDAVRSGLALFWPVARVSNITTLLAPVAVVAGILQPARKVDRQRAFCYVAKDEAGVLNHPPVILNAPTVSPVGAFLLSRRPVHGSPLVGRPLYFSRSSSALKWRSSTSFRNAARSRRIQNPMSKAATNPTSEHAIPSACGISLTGQRTPSWQFGLVDRTPGRRYRGPVPADGEQ